VKQACAGPSDFLRRANASLSERSPHPQQSLVRTRPRACIWSYDRLSLPIGLRRPARRVRPQRFACAESSHRSGRIASAWAARYALEAGATERSWNASGCREDRTQIGRQSVSNRSGIGRKSVGKWSRNRPSVGFRSCDETPGLAPTCPHPAPRPFPAARTIPPWPPAPSGASPAQIPTVAWTYRGGC
jgi:hypothetical protein